MALLFVDGFDAGDVSAKWTQNPGAVTSTTTRFGVGRSIAVPYGSFSPKKIFTSQLTQVFCGFAYAASGVGAQSPFFHVWGDTGNTIHLTVSWDNGTTIQLRRGNWGDTLIASAACTKQAWQYVEVSAVVHDTTGSCVVRVNGVTVINFSGDTKNGGTLSSIDAVSCGLVYSSVATNYYDDLYICDATGPAPYNTFLGEIRINTLVPTGAGSDTQFAPSTGANYTTVDELPYSTADYVSATSAGTRDLYAMSDLSGSYSVLAVQNNVIGKKLDVGSTAVKPTIKSGGTIYYGASQTLTSNDVTITDTRTVDPATGATWTQNGVNALEAGMELA